MGRASIDRGKAHRTGRSSRGGPHDPRDRSTHPNNGLRNAALDMVSPELALLLLTWIVHSIVFVPPGGPFRFIDRRAAVGGKLRPIV